MLGVLLLLLIVKIQTFRLLFLRIVIKRTVKKSNRGEGQISRHASYVESNRKIWREIAGELCRIRFVSAEVKKTSQFLASPERKIFNVFLFKYFTVNRSFQ